VLSPCRGADKGEDEDGEGDGLTEAPVAAALPASARPGWARPRGRWGFGGQDVRAEPGGRWEEELKAQRPRAAAGEGLAGAAGAVLAAASLSQLLGMEGQRRAGRAPSSFAPSKGLDANGNRGWKRKRKQLSSGKGFWSDMEVPHTAGTPAPA